LNYKIFRERRVEQDILEHWTDIKNKVSLRKIKSQYKCR